MAGLPGVYPIVTLSRLLRRFVTREESSRKSDILGQSCLSGEPGPVSLRCLSPTVSFLEVCYTLLRYRSTPGYRRVHQGSQGGALPGPGTPCTTHSWYTTLLHHRDTTVTCSWTTVTTLGRVPRLEEQEEYTGQSYLRLEEQEEYTGQSYLSLPAGGKNPGYSGPEEPAKVKNPGLF